MTPLTLSDLNNATPDGCVALLAGIYEHSPWVAERAAAQRPYATLAQLKAVLRRVVDEAGADAQIALVRAHPELAGKAMIDRSLTAESTSEQSRAGLTRCTPEEFARLQQLNADYTTRFGWPFLLAVRGPRGSGLSPAEILSHFERRVGAPRDAELAECLHQIHRVAELRLNDKFGYAPVLGDLVWDWCAALAAHSDPGYAEAGQLTVTYLTDAHRACAAQLSGWMTDCGFDEVEIDAVGNVVAVYHASPDVPASGRLLTGSHYDTVRNAGRYDGRLGILVGMAAVRELRAAGRRLPFGIEVVGFAEEEGQRFDATFIGSSALTGQFNAAWLDQQDANGITMRDAMRTAGLPGNIDAIAALKRNPGQYLGFVEVHIEQGPVLNELGLPLGIVTAINGSLRYLGELQGQASHAGTTPMNRRRDAAAAAAELALYAEARASSDGDSVATVGQLQVPNGSINVVPGRCRFSLDMRAPTNAQRDRLAGDVLQQLQRITERRRVQLELHEAMRASAAPSAPEWQARWEAAVAALGLPPHRLPSGAGHDAMKLHELLPQAMLFVRGEHGGISHNPLESTTSDDIQLAVEAFLLLLDGLAREQATP